MRVLPTSHYPRFVRYGFQLIQSKNIEIIFLAGFLKILSKNFIRKFKGKILNIHPSLLPKFKGLDTFKRVLKAKEKYGNKFVSKLKKWVVL